jgi:hypothetical protein
MSNYPVQPIPDDAPVFVTEQLKSIRYNVYRHQFNRILERSGIEKKITLHDLRHARVTHLSAEGLSESVIKLMIWGDVGTSMLGSYQHLSNQDIDRQVRELYGLQTRTQPATRWSPGNARGVTWSTSPMLYTAIGAERASLRKQVGRSAHTLVRQTTSWMRY